MQNSRSSDAADDPRNHIVLSPHPWVAGQSDIGQRHHRNEDSIALAASEEQGARAVLVVCDGVSTSTDSQLASQAASVAAMERLSQPMPRRGVAQDVWLETAAQAFADAAQAGSAAAAETGGADDPTPPSCTMAAAIVEDNLIVGGNVGDSRVYWIPASGPERAVQLGSDDSMAHELIRRGVPRENAENAPNAHAITRWLGRNAPKDLTPRLAHLLAEEPGWLIVCSDGLWNYCSAPADLWDLVQRVRAARGDDPTEITDGLVGFANASGGADNISVVIAALAPQPA
ncbi:PP2C family protein-serine/threonine phosphatase [Flexivirga caeni]|uniref:PP2C family protein-serine/threonine phosphatase n=1 Tax=Flexivirga caeni TaxID=2294115 RepID=UPI00131532DC|nr:protein phosphatase 2C domain-containing protein [Flexivirga caeni]